MEIPIMVRRHLYIYRKISNIRRTKSQDLNVSLISSCSRLCPIPWNPVLSGEWRCSWSSADRRCSNYIWVINDLIVNWGAAYIRDFTVTEWTPLYLNDYTLSQHFDLFWSLLLWFGIGQFYSCRVTLQGLRPANKRRRYKVTPSLIGWAQTYNQPCFTVALGWSLAWTQASQWDMGTQRAHDAIITSLWRQNDVATSFWRHNDVVIASSVRWVNT